MNNWGKSIAKKFGYTFGANTVSLLMSVLAVSIFPKYMTVEDYGLYQLFLFYFGYVGFLHFGTLGGAIIRYSGCTYFDLDFSILKSQCLVLFGVLCVLSTGIFAINVLTHIFVNNNIFIMFIISMFAQHVIWYSISILQMSNRIEDVARLLLWERISWGILSISAVLLGFANVLTILFIYCATRILVMLYSLMFIPEIVGAPLNFTAKLLKELKINFALGFPITLSDICSILTIGIIRFAISDVWDIVVFAKTSLVLSITFFFLSFITSASTVLLPALKQLKNSVSNDIYLPLNRLSSYVFLHLLILYYPIKLIILFWLPKYSDSIIFMGILFPIVFFESKFNFLLVTYLKKIFKTKVIFYINVVSTFISLLGGLLFCYYMKNLELSIFLITMVLGIRYSLGEFVLYRYLKMPHALIAEYLLNIFWLILFELCVRIDNTILGFLLYFSCLIIYTWLNRKKLTISWKCLKKIIV
jgi:O-antigen/teichoic acid export membrane protein